MKQSKGAPFAKSPDVANCLDDDALIAKTIFGISTLQLDMMSKIKKLEENQNIILEESRLERSKHNAIVEALEKHYDKEMGRFMEMVNLLVENMNRREQLNSDPGRQIVSRGNNAVPTLAPNATMIPPFQGLNVAAPASFFPNQTMAPHGAVAAPATLQSTPTFGNPAVVNHQQISNFQQLLSSPYHLLQQQLALQQQQQATAAAAAAAAVQTQQFSQPQPNSAGPLIAVRGVTLGSVPAESTFSPTVSAQCNLPNVKAAVSAPFSTPLATKPAVVTTAPVFKSSGSQESNAQGTVSQGFKPLGSGNLFSDAASRGFTSFSSIANEVKAAESAEKSSLPASSEGNSTARKSSPVKDTSRPDDEVEEFVPTAHFEPVIPLPALIDAKTGEEDEEVLFKSRAKLYRYVKASNEYKERGIGDIKILRSGDNKHRIVMRRDQVLKVCANVPLRVGMIINKKPGTENTCIWACTDYSESAEGVDECFVVRFKTPQLADEFMKIFREALDSSGVKKGGGKTSERREESGTVSSQSKQAVVETDETATSGPINATNSGSNVSTKKNDSFTGKKVEQGFGDAFKPPPGSWECKSCYTRNEADASVCPCCGTKKDGTIASSSFGSSVISSTTAPLKEGSFSFGITTGVPFPKSSTSTPEHNSTSGTISFGLSKGDTTGGSTPKTTNSLSGSGLPTFSFSPLTGTKSASVSSNSALSFSTVNVPSASKPESTSSTATTKPVFSFAKPVLSVSTTSTADVKPTFSFALTALKPSAQNNAKEKTFSFKPADSKTTLAQSKFGNLPVFGGKPVELNTDTPKEGGTAVKPTTNSLFGASAGNSPFSGSVFGGSSSGGFAALAAKCQNESKNSEPETDDKKSNLFQSSSFGKNDKPMFSSFSKADSATKEGNSGKADDDVEEFVPTAHFEPVIPLPALVETKTGEEDEKVLFKCRAKLYRYIKMSKEYKERGVGDVKILRSKDGKCRVVMRRDQVLKVCANAPITAGMKISKKPNTDNACIWMCKDFTDDIEGSDECFVFRFKTAQLADEFLSSFHAAVNESPQTNSKTDGGSPTEKKELNDAKTSSPSSSQAGKDSLASNNKGSDGPGKCDEEGNVNYHVERYPVTAEIMDAFPSPLKPCREVEVKGTCILRFRDEFEEVRLGLETDDGVTKLDSTVCAKDEFTGPELSTISCQVVDNDGRNVKAYITFGNVQDARAALDCLLKGKESAIEKEY